MYSLTFVQNKDKPKTKALGEKKILTNTDYKGI